MGNGATKNREGSEMIQRQYGINPERIEEIGGKYYLSLEREKYKLPKNVVDAFERSNNFSHEKDPANELKHHHTKHSKYLNK